MEIAEEIDSLRNMEAPELLDRYRELFGKEPRVRNKEWLRKRIGWRLQEQRYGGLSTVAKRRLEELIAEIDLPRGDRQRTVTGALRSRAPAPQHQMGTVFTRVWRGREVRAVAVEDGFKCEGVLYRSLSAVAKGVTGSHWNGRLFFGLTTRKKKK